MPNAKDAPTIVVMAKKPSLGAVKTRLGEAFSDEERLRLYAAFLTDKIEQVTRVGARVVVAVAPPDPPDALTPWLGAATHVELVPQEGSDLGQRLAGLSERHFRTSTAPLVICDSDTPTLPVHFFEEALAALASGTADVVLGPASDGGYYLIGLSRPLPELFEGISWSTARVLSQTLSRAESARGGPLVVHMLQSWRDIDTPRDVAALARELSVRPPSTVGYPVRTAAVVSDLVPRPADPPRNVHWTTLSSRSVYENRWMSVSENVVALPSGGHTLYGVVRTGPCVGIVPFVDERHVVLVKQFRYVAQRFTWEIPTGGVHPDESIEDAARRELREEAGWSAGSLELLTSFTPSKSILDEVAHLYVARDLTPSQSRPDETESFCVETVPLEVAIRMARSGEIVDSMSLVALLLLSRGP